MLPADPEQFARSWIDAWNRYDLDAAMSYYSEETEFSSPWVVTINGDQSGTLRGMAALRAFWEKCIALAPGARLELLYVLTGVDTITLVYRYHGRLQLIEAETMAFLGGGPEARTVLPYRDLPSIASLATFCRASRACVR